MPAVPDLATLWSDQLLPNGSWVLVHAGWAVLAAAATAAAARLALQAVRRALARTGANANARLLIDRLLQFAFLLLGAAWVLSIFGVQLTALVALLGVAGLAVSLALQDLLRNLVAGLYILIERPFTIGEHIDFKGASGTVETIRLRTAALRSAAGQRVIIPNAMLFADMLVNRSAYGRQPIRIRVAVPLETGTDVGSGEQLQKELLGALEQAGATAAQPAPAVMVESLASDKATLRVEAWAPNPRAAAPKVAWALRQRVPRAEIIVLEDGAGGGSGGKA